MAGGFERHPLDLDLVSNISAQIGEALDHAPFDPSAWEDVATHLSDIFPQGAAALLSIDPPRGALNLELVKGLEAGYVASYKAHYSFINPWMNLLSRGAPGSVFLSERDYPAHSFQNSEFYSDWLAPQRSIDASSAIMFEATPHDLVLLALHYPANLSESVGRVSEEVLKRIRGPLKRSAEIGRRLNDLLLTERSAAALVARSDDIVFVTDGNRRVHDMNGVAEAEFRRRRLLVLRANLVYVLAPEADNWLADTLQQLAQGISMDCTSRLFRNDDEFYQISIAALPRSSRPGIVVSSRPLFLVTLRPLLGRENHGSTALIGSAFALTAAEIRLCASLAQNLTLKEAAMQLGLTVGTARDRLKTIFQKTGTHRQSELIGLIKRLL